MSARRLVVWIAFLAVFAMSARISVDTDTWWHLKAGQWIVENRQVPQQDPFSYTRLGEPWQYPGWLVEVPLYLLFRLSGPGGLNLWTAAMVTLAFAFVWRTMSGGEYLKAFVLILAATASGVYWAARPYMVTFVLAAVFLWLLEGDRKGAASRIKWLPVLMVLWANSHGGFIVGFLLWGVYLVEKLTRAQGVGRRFPWVTGLPSGTRSFTLVGLLMVAAVVLNPSGPILLLYPFRTLSISALQENIQEWQSPDFHALQTQPFLWLFLALLGAAGASRRRISVVDLSLVSGFGYLAFTAGRNIALFSLIAPMVLTRHLDPLIAELTGRLGWRLPAGAAGAPRSSTSRLNWALLALVFVATVLKAGLVVPARENWDHFQATLPVRAVDYLQERRLPGRLFNTYNWGGYLIWALPQYPVFIDGRTDLYDGPVIDEWLQVARAETGWQAVLETWDVSLVLFEPGMPVVKALEAEGWRLAYEDPVAVLFARPD